MSTLEASSGKSLGSGDVSGRWEFWVAPVLNRRCCFNIWLMWRCPCFSHGWCYPAATCMLCFGGVASSIRRKRLGFPFPVVAVCCGSGLSVHLFSGHQTWFLIIPRFVSKAYCRFSPRSRVKRFCISCETYRVRFSFLISASNDRNKHDYNAST